MPFRLYLWSHFLHQWSGSSLITSSKEIGRWSVWFWRRRAGCRTPSWELVGMIWSKWWSNIESLDLTKRLLKIDIWPFNLTKWAWLCCTGPSRKKTMKCANCSLKVKLKVGAAKSDRGGWLSQTTRASGIPVRATQWNSRVVADGSPTLTRATSSIGLLCFQPSKMATWTWSSSSSLTEPFPEFRTSPANPASTSATRRSKNWRTS